MNNVNKYSIFLILALVFLLFSWRIQKPPFIELNPKNVISNPSGLSPFWDYIKLHSDQEISIFHIGDSHIEMGYITNEIKKRLSEKFGKGIDGWQFPYQLFNPQSETYFAMKEKGDWKKSTIKQKKDSVLLGVNGQAFYTNDSSANLTFTNSMRFGILHSVSFLHFTTSSVFFQVEEAAIHSEQISKNTSITTITADTPGKNIRIHFSGSIVPIYAIRINHSNKKGISYHNLGVSGSTLMEFTTHTKLFHEQIKSLKPNLLIVSLGTNDSYRNSLDFEKDYVKIVSFFTEIRTVCPSTAILFTTAPDTKYKNMHPSKLALVNKMIKKAAEETGSSCWDLFHIMGGENSIEIWEKQGLVNKDRLHFTPKGYRNQGALLSTALLKTKH